MVAFPPFGRSMGYIRLLAILALATALSPSAMPDASQARERDVVGKALHQPETRAEGREAIDAAVAAAIVGAISSQFGERKVQVKLDHVSTTPNSLVEADVLGDGRLSLGDAEDGDWLPFRFAALYDTSTATASAPRLVIGGSAPGRTVPADSAIAVELRRQVQARLQGEFRRQPVRFSLDSVDALEMGRRYSRIDARGTVDFDQEGRVPADVHALYDRRGNAWLQLSYELGSTANREVASGG
jgi:hypothetical protein